MHLKKKFWNEMVYFQMGIWDTKEIKANEDSLIIEWYASTKDLDRHNDIVVPKAFDSSLKWYLKNNPILLLGHDDSKSIWTVTKWEIDKKGLKITAEVKNNIDEIFERIQNGTTKTFSIWFIPKAWHFILNWKIIADENGIKDGSSFDDLMKKETFRKITDMELVEISVVNVPANGNAVFAFKKSLELNKQFIMEKWFTSFNQDEQKNEDEMIDRIKEEEKVEEPKKEEIIEEEIIEDEKIEEETSKEEEKVEEGNSDSKETIIEEGTDGKVIDTTSDKENDTSTVENEEKVEEIVEKVEEIKEEVKEVEEWDNNDEAVLEIDNEIEEEKKIWLIVEKTIAQYKKANEWDNKEDSSENLETDWNTSDVEAQTKEYTSSLEKRITELEKQIKEIPVNKWQVFLESEVKKEKGYTPKWFQSF